MSNSSVDLQTEATSNGPEGQTTNGKKSSATNGRNGLETETETDLGSAASSANSSGDDGEASEDEDDDEDPEVSFTKKKPSNSRRTTRQATRSKTRKNDQSSSSKHRKEKQKKSTSRGRNNSSPAPVEKKSSNRVDRRIRRGSPASLKTLEVTKPKRTRKSSMIESCQLCSDMVEDLSRHLSLNHFKSKLVKLLPSQSPFKCPKCASVESSHDNLISHYGGQHKLNDRYLDEELNSKTVSSTTSSASKDKKTNGTRPRSRPSSGTPTRNTRRSSGTPTLSTRRSARNTRSSSVDSNSQIEVIVDCKLCGKANLLESQLKDHAVDVHFKEEILAPLPRSPPFRCPKCPSRSSNSNFDSFDQLSSHFLSVHDPVSEAFVSRLTSTPKTSPERNHVPDPPPLKTPKRSPSPQPKKKKDGRGRPRGGFNRNDSPSFRPIEAIEESGEDETRPPQAWHCPRPRSHEEYLAQIGKWLRLNDGRVAKAVDDTTMKCVCDKNFRTNLKYNWRFLIQRPTLRDGKPNHKGHWFRCPEVAKGGTIIENWKFSKADIEASYFNSKGCDDKKDELKGRDSRDSSPLKRTRKRGLLTSESCNSLDSEGAMADSKKGLYNEDDSEDESDLDEEDMAEETTKQQRLIIRKRVNDLLNTRVPGLTFLQDGPCFQVN